MTELCVVIFTFSLIITIIIAAVNIATYQMIDL